MLKRDRNCHLCGEYLDRDGGDVASDHFIAGGPIDASNVYLAHGSCNSLRQDLDVPVARNLIRFKKYLEQHRDLNLDQVLDKYAGRPRAKTVRVSIDEKKRLITIDGQEAKLYRDPVGWSFFYFDLPADRVVNDLDVQPRTIKFDHVQKLLKDFTRNPVHEPAACRLVPIKGGQYEARMFDGQHKTAAQLALGRKTVHVKVYIDPPIDQVRQLVKAVQSTIPKLPLSPGAFSKKMRDVHREAWENYLGAAGDSASEVDFIASFPTSQERRAAKSDLLQAHVAEAWHPEERESSKILRYVQPDNPEPTIRYALKQPTFKSKLLNALICQRPLEEKDPEQRLRAVESTNVRRLLDAIVTVALEHEWVELKSEPETPEHQTSNRFFQQGAMIGWVELLRKAIVNVCSADPDEKDRPLLRPITEDQWRQIHDVVRRLYRHPLWSMGEAAVQEVINLNKPKSTQALLRKHNLTFEYALTGHT